MAKLDVKVDVELGPALKVILRLVKAFGAVAQAEDVEQAGALAEAYALIEQHLQGQVGRAASEIENTVRQNSGEFVVVGRRGMVPVKGRVGACELQIFYLGESPVPYSDVEYIDVVKSTVWPTCDFWPGNNVRLIDFLKRHTDEKVAVTRVNGTVLAGTLFWNMLDVDYAAFQVIDSDGVYQPLELECVETIRAI